MQNITDKICKVLCKSALDVKNNKNKKDLFSERT